VRIDRHGPGCANCAGRLARKDERRWGRATGPALMARLLLDDLFFAVHSPRHRGIRGKSRGPASPAPTAFGNSRVLAAILLRDHQIRSVVGVRTRAGVRCLRIRRGNPYTTNVISSYGNSGDSVVHGRFAIPHSKKEGREVNTLKNICNTLILRFKRNSLQEAHHAILSRSTGRSP